MSIALGELVVLLSLLLSNMMMFFFFNSCISMLFVGGHDLPFASIKMTKALQAFNNKIIECRFEFNGETGSWVFMRERTDKTFPNSFKTALCE